MTLVASQAITKHKLSCNDQINTLRRQNYNSVSPKEKERRAVKRRAYAQARRDYCIKNKSFVCYSCLDKSGESLCFSGKLELNRHLRTNRHLRSAFRMLESKVEDPIVEITSMPVEECTNADT